MLESFRLEVTPVELSPARGRARLESGGQRSLRIEVLLVAALSVVLLGAAESSPLILEAKIPLGSVRGRMDHFAVDPQRQRLFLAELGNDTVAVIDWTRRERIRTLTGLHEPQGLGYVAATDTLYVANGGDGSVRLFRGADLSPGDRIEVGGDADNVRVDGPRNRVLVGHDGGIAILDPLTRRKVADIPLAAHPESFQLDPKNGRIYVNLPSARNVAVLDLVSGRSLAQWPLREVERNYPMAIDEAADRIVVVGREPPRLVVFTPDGTLVANLETCGDADDVFVDSKRKRVYVSCGSGAVDGFREEHGSYLRMGRVATASGARTAFFLPGADRLYVAVRASETGPAAVWVFRPAVP